MATFNSDAATTTVAALVKAGRLGDEHEALVRAVLTLAVAVDEAPGNASLWREYRAALASLMEVGADDAQEDEEAWVDAVRAPLRDAEDAG